MRNESNLLVILTLLCLMIYQRTSLLKSKFFKLLQMNVNIEKLPKCLTDISATLPSEDVANKKGAILSAYIKDARIPGFRPGKAPKRVIEKRYAKEIESEIESQIFRELLNHAVEEEKVSFLTIKDRKLTHESDGSVKADLTLIVSPEFELPEYKGIEVTVPEVKITSEDVDAEILQIRRQQAEYPTKEEGGVETGNVAVISYDSTCDGVATEEAFEVSIDPYGKKEEFWVKVGEDNFLPGFSSELEGMVVGSEKVIAHTFADDFAIEELRGKTFDYTVTLKEIKTEELPELGDLVKKMMGEETTEEVFRERVESYITQQAEKNVNDQKVGTILEKLSEGLEFDLPEDYLQSETQNQADRLVQQSMSYGLDEEAVTKMKDSIISQAAKNAEVSLRNHFIILEIAEKESLEVKEEEVMQKVFMEAYQKGEDPQKAYKQAKSSGADYNYKQSILMDKVVDFLVEQANITVENAESNTTDEQ